jgi:beta-lactamase regulating signal transducer with metallopeptidase domain
MISDTVPVLLEAAARALFAALVLWAGLRLLRVRNVPVQKTAWGLVLALALAMPLLMRMPLPAWARIPVPAPAWLHAEAPVALHADSRARAADPLAAAQAAQTPASNLDAAPESARVAPLAGSAPQISTSAFDPLMGGAPERARAAAPVSLAPNSAHSSFGAGFSTLAIARWLYFIVGAALLFRLLFALATSLRLWLRARPVEIPGRLGHPRAIPVRVSHRIASPVNVGSGIVLPGDYDSWDAEKLRVVLAHERSHVRQRDFYLQLLAGLYAALLWFSPLGWWLKRKLSELSEAISDRAALGAARSPSAYAELLLEFAALPRPPLTGVAMARAHHLSARIERLLNEAAFGQSFGRSRRALAALLLVPVAILASTTLVRVHAAAMPGGPGAVLEAAQAQAQDATPPPAQDSTAPTAPAAAPAPSAEPAPPAPPDAAAPAQDASAPVAPIPPMPAVVIPPINIPSINFPAITIPPIPDLDGVLAGVGRGGFGICEEACALVGEPGTSPRYFGGFWSDDSSAEEIDKARKAAHGPFFWFRKDGKSYIINDLAVVSQVEAMQSRIDDLRKQMRDLRDQQRGEGAQMREEARKQREATRTLAKPDLSEAVSQLDAAVAQLKSSQGDTVTREQLQEIQRRLSEIQSKLIASEVKVNFNSADWSKWSEQMSKFGQQMGALGAQMGQVAKENRDKIRSLIDESMKDGKARPVE